MVPNENPKVPALASLDLTVGSLPTAAPDHVTRWFGCTNTFAVSLLLANDSRGAVFDSLVSPLTTLGGAVSVTNGVVTYLPPLPDPGGNDTFSYRIRDAHGLSAVGLVTVGICLPGGTPIGNLSIRSSAAGTAVIGNRIDGSASWLGLPNTNTTFFRAWCAP